MGIIVTNPPGGYTWGTEEDDTFIVTNGIDTWRDLQGAGGFDTLLIDRGFDNGSRVYVRDFGGGRFDGRVTDAIGSLAYVAFSDMEHVTILGSPGSDYFELAIQPSSSALPLAFDAGAGEDGLSFDFAGYTQSISFVVGASGISSSYGQFAGFEVFTLYGGAGNDELRTGAGNDSLRGGAGTNILDAGGGNDSVFSSSLTDWSDGGAGYDFWGGGASASDASALTVDIGGDVRVNGSVVAVNFESVSFGGGSGNDLFSVTGGATTQAYGGDGSDTFSYQVSPDLRRAFSVSGEAGALFGSVAEDVFTTGHVTFQWFETINLFGGDKDDSFSLRGVFASGGIRFAAGAGSDELVADLRNFTDSTMFIVHGDGTIESNRGQFSGFERFSITGGTSADTITGWTGNDTLDGGDGNDVLDGGAGNDQIDTRDGDDLVHGGAGADRINIGLGAKTVYGDADDDILDFHSVSVGGVSNAIGLLDGGAGFDTLQFFFITPVTLGTIETAPGIFELGAYVGSQRYVIRAVERIQFSNADEIISLPPGYSQPIELRGGGGNDIFTVGPNARAIGEGGNDEFFVSGAFGGAPTQGSIQGGAGIDLLKLNIGFTVDLEARTASAGTASFEILSIEQVQAAAVGGYLTTIRGSGANETLSVNPLFDDGSVGVRFFGAGGNDRLSGSIAGDELEGGDGNDVIDGRGGNDLMTGGTGNDTYIIEGDDSVIEAAGGGSDYVAAQASYILAAGAEVELLSTTDNGGTAAINLTGNAFNQILVGNAGSNALDGGGGADSLVGLGGNDIYVVEGDDQVSEAAGGGSDYVAARASFILTAGAEVELVSTTDNSGTAAINLTGNALGQVLVGNDGANSLNGGGGADLLVGLGGDDTYLVDADDRVVEAAGGGADYIAAKGSFILEAGSDVELLSTTDNGGTEAINLTGNALNQVLVGNAGANYLDGSSGADLLVGLGGNDTYILEGDDSVIEGVGGGSDYIAAKASFVLNSGAEIEVISTTDNGGTAAINLTGNELGQSVIGNAGSNVLDGKAGADFLLGLGGADSFAFTSALGGGNVDTIGDFSAADDNILLDDAVFAALAPGGLNANAFVIGAAATTADHRIVYNGGQLFYDADGSGAGAAILFATLSGAPVISASDFTVI